MYHFKGSEKASVIKITLYKLRELFFNGADLPKSYFKAISLLKV